VQWLKFFRMQNAAYSAIFARVFVVLMAWIMGMYFISSVLLLRMTIPQSYRESISKVMGNVQVPFFHFWFDVVFLMSALLSLLLSGWEYAAKRESPADHLASSKSKRSKQARDAPASSTRVRCSNNDDTIEGGCCWWTVNAAKIVVIATRACPPAPSLERGTHRIFRIDLRL